MGYRLLSGIVPLLLLAGAASGCLEEKVTFDELLDRASGSAQGDVGGDASTDIGDDVPVVTSTTTTTSTTQATTTSTSTTSEPCRRFTEDSDGNVIHWNKKNPQRMYAKEAYKFSYNIEGVGIEGHGVALAGLADSACFDSQFVYLWPGFSDQEGTTGIQGNPSGDSTLYHGLPSFVMPERPKESAGDNDWPFATFSYVAYVVTQGGAVFTTPLDDAILGQGLIEVRFHAKGNAWGYDSTTQADPAALGLL